MGNAQQDQADAPKTPQFRGSYILQTFYPEISETWLKLPQLRAKAPTLWLVHLPPQQDYQD